MNTPETDQNRMKSPELDSDAECVPARLYAQLEQKFRELVTTCEALSRRVSELESAHATISSRLKELSDSVANCLKSLKSISTKNEVAALAKTFADISSSVLAIAAVLELPSPQKPHPSTHWPQSGTPSPGSHG